MAELWDTSIENTIRKLAYGTILGALGGLLLFRAPSAPLHTRTQAWQGPHGCGRVPRSVPRACQPVFYSGCWARTRASSC